ncbi:MAG: hypothetical protein F4056_07015 [Chloroflexi bacterium]|nr:hypothetical protein [Gammaproteobacteria bacterium]MYH47328.1 hypothetical protein [Gammaproteobacteria bacterium]MYI83037.1 hypothetical protein [Chloroflexota bacterium]MYL12946.1 hypothetical protein [Gammaproteobacteria bacterium]
MDNQEAVILIFGMLVTSVFIVVIVWGIIEWIWDWIRWLIHDPWAVIKLVTKIVFFILAVLFVFFFFLTGGLGFLR